MKLQHLSIALLIAFGFVGATQAAIESGQSYSGTGLVIISEAATDLSGAGVNGLPTPYNEPRSFSHFTFFGADSNNVYSFISSAAFSSPWIPPVHKELGYWGFQDLGINDVWFGEWAPENRSAGAPNGTIDYTKRVVYFSGNTTGLSLPSSGTVNYSVKGINQYNASPNLLTGTYTANFTGSGGSLSGSLTGGTAAAGIKTLTLGTTTFNTAGKITGSATGTNQANAAIGTGTVSGQFFGNQAVAGQGGLAGFTKFSNRNYDTAFGGKN